MRMEAYYYEFTPTGSATVDKLLSAVACAGKAYHHTREWNDDAYDGEAPEPHTGRTPVEWIQIAAREAAEEMERLRLYKHYANGIIEGQVDEALRMKRETGKYPFED